MPQLTPLNAHFASPGLQASTVATLNWWNSFRCAMLLSRSFKDNMWQRNFFQEAWSPSPLV